MSLSRRGREDGEEGDGGHAAGGEDQWGSMPGKRPRRCSCSCSCCQDSKDFYEGQIQILKKEMQCMSKGFVEERKTFQREMQEFYQNSQLRIEQLIQEQFNTLISEISTSGDHVREYSSHRALSHQSKNRTCRLRFENKCSNVKYSGRVIAADDGNPIKVAICDHDNRIITDGPLSSMQVKIIVLDGDFNKENKERWSGDSFLKNIVCGRTGKPPFFASEPRLTLKNGVANLYGIKFQDNIPSKKFRLGVMAADDNVREEILEGISESCTIKSGRSYQKKKDPHPFLSDPIYKLKKIGDDRHKLLDQLQIKLVRDFLWSYNKDKDSPRKACETISDHDWEIIVEHALSCKPGHERYSYRIPAMDATIFFNSLYNIAGAEFNGKYSSYEELDGNQKDLAEAFKTKEYDNLEAVQNEDKSPCHEHEVIAGDKGGCYLRGSCSIQPLPTLPTKFHDGHSHHDEVLESAPAQESPRPHQRWVKIVTTVTTLHYWNKESVESASIREMISTLWTEIALAQTDMLLN